MIKVLENKVVERVLVLSIMLNILLVVIFFMLRLTDIYTGAMKVAEPLIALLLLNLAIYNFNKRRVISIIYFASSIILFIFFIVVLIIFR